MNPRTNSVSCALRRKPLAASVVALFALAAPEAFAANTWHVTSCADSGTGSLRNIIVNNAASGDTVDFSQLDSTNCPSSTISLTTGAITIGETLSLQGPLPPNPRITITGYYNGAYQNDRLINHTMPGSQLLISNLNFEYGKFSPAGDAHGGCIYSAGSVNLNNVMVFHCQATANGAGKHAKGGGLYVKGDLSMKYSRITANTAAAGTGGAFVPAAGGIYVGGSFSATDSTIDGNSAPFGNVGGVLVDASSSKSAIIVNSTISGNNAGFTGGIYINSANPVQITNSTISGNHSTGYVGGLASNSASVTIQNSTIAFNTAANATPDQGAGIYLNNSSAATAFAVTLQSSILSNNTYGTTENDFSAHASGGGTFNITSNNNIIRATPGTIRPATVTTACPLLGPLRDNGGPTPTHALLSRSPAIDAGNNNANLVQDQRGRPFDATPYPYPRDSGIAPDIGAYEVQQNDIIFNTSFEGCPALF